MKIFIANSIGSGSTKLSAFDNALCRVGAENYNLIALSSVIPGDSEVVEVNSFDLSGEWGDRLYVVMAERAEDEVGREAWAGIGWVQDPSTKRGLFVEHSGASHDEVRQDIENSLNDLLKNRNMQDLEIHMSINGGKCVDKPISALTIAVYRSCDWNGNYGN
jgi:arginine decarboxylase